MRTFLLPLVQFGPLERSFCHLLPFMNEITRHVICNREGCQVIRLPGERWIKFSTFRLKYSDVDGMIITGDLIIFYYFLVLSLFPSRKFPCWFFVLVRCRISVIQETTAHSISMLCLPLENGESFYTSFVLVKFLFCFSFLVKRNVS